jgi:hypothetical protein
MTVIKVKTASGWIDMQAVPSTLAVQEVRGNRNAYDAMVGNGAAVKRDASNDLQLTYTPPVNCYWDVEAHLSRVKKDDAAWHYIQFDLRLNILDMNGRNISPDFIVECHLDGWQHACIDLKMRWQLQAGIAYTCKMHKSGQEGGTYTYHQGSDFMYLRGTAFVA